ncbi:recombinase family protein [Nocardioides agariphilus]|uniref:Recombinase family protein n=1 Tax=Nocardioides agariphilus TaxID=433664 RepID=A0A930YNF4_9ACTN|nr:recombinase family protein [Nocardioides agariphilus]
MEVCIYVRLSYDLRGNELGVERQERECREYAQARGWTVSEVFIDNDLSATTGVERPEFERLLASKPTAILCWHLDRLLRVSGDLERVIALNVNVYAKEAGWFDLSTPAGRAVARTVTAWSTYEGEQKAIRQKAAHRQRVDAGGLTATGRPWWPTRPLGFNLDGTHHEIEAPALRQVYADLLNGGTLAAGVRYLEQCGIVTARSGRPWKASSLRPVLLNARNAGIYLYNGEEVGPAAWEPIVEEEVFRAVVRILSNPARRLNGENSGGFGHRTNLLTGLAKCSKCDHTVRAAWRRNAKGERTYKFYQCGGCHGATVPSEWADSVVTRKVIERVEEWRDMLPQGSTAGTVDVDALKARVKALESSKEELVEDRSLGILSREQLRAGLAKADTEIAKITDELTAHVSEGDGPWFWDTETLWAWSDDGEGNVDVEKFTPVVKRVCKSIAMTGPGKGKKDLLYGTHLVIDFFEPR